MSTVIAMAAALVVLGGLLLWLINWYFHEQRRRGSQLPPVPEVPGLPVIGNALQLRERKPHSTFVKWVKTYGPIFSIRVGSKSIVVLNNQDVAKEAIGRDVEYINVEELGRLSRPEIYKILMTDPIEIALEYVDWRDFFPYLRWIPQRNFERKIEKMEFRRLAVMKALIKEQSERAASGEEMNYCYLKYLLTEGKTLTERQIASLLWEVIIESSDTTMVTTEWALFKLAKNPKLQESLYKEIQSICGSDKITEENLCRLPLLDAVFHETLRTHIPLPIVPLRYVHEDTELGGYYVPAGSEIAINLYGCNMDENRWEKPEEWNPERFLDDNKKYAPSDSYKTMAFGAGKRLCPGALQVTLIVCTTIGRLVQEFEWRLEDGEEEDVEIVGIINQKLHPMHAVIRPRNL